MFHQNEHIMKASVLTLVASFICFMQFSVFAFQNANTPTQPLTFTLEKIGASSAQIEWMTASKKEGTYYEIQRSSNGLDFNTISLVPAISVHEGNTYTYIDERANSGNNFYRIKQIDEQTEVHLSSAKEIYLNAPTVGLALAVNNANNTVELDIQTLRKGAMKISLSDKNGLLIAEYFLTAQQGLNKIKIPTGDLQDGKYQLNIHTPTTQLYRSFKIERSNADSPKA